MNNDEIRELDKWIGRHVFGLDVQDHECGMTRRPDYKHAVEGQSGLWQSPLDSYTTDPASAMLVLEKCAEKLDTIGEPPDEIVIRRQGGMFTVCGYTKGGYFGRSSDTLPLAICLFARQLFTDQKQKI